MTISQQELDTIKGKFPEKTRGLSDDEIYERWYEGEFKDQEEKKIEPRDVPSLMRELPEEQKSAKERRLALGLSGRGKMRYGLESFASPEVIAQELKTVKKRYEAPPVYAEARKKLSPQTNLDKLLDATGVKAVASAPVKAWDALVHAKEYFTLPEDKKDQFWREKVRGEEFVKDRWGNPVSRDRIELTQSIANGLRRAQLKQKAAGIKSNISQLSLSQIEERAKIIANKFGDDPALLGIASALYTTGELINMVGTHIAATVMHPSDSLYGALIKSVGAGFDERVFKNELSKAFDNYRKYADLSPLPNGSEARQYMLKKMYGLDVHKDVADELLGRGRESSNAIQGGLEFFAEGLGVVKGISWISKTRGTRFAKKFDNWLVGKGNSEAREMIGAKTGRTINSSKDLSNAEFRMVADKWISSKAAGGWPLLKQDWKYGFKMRKLERGIAYQEKARKRIGLGPDPLHKRMGQRQIKGRLLTRSKQRIAAHNKEYYGYLLAHETAMHEKTMLQRSLTKTKVISEKNTLTEKLRQKNVEINELKNKSRNVENNIDKEILRNTAYKNNLIATPDQQLYLGEIYFATSASLANEAGFKDTAILFGLGGAVFGNTILKGTNELLTHTLRRGVHAVDETFSILDSMSRIPGFNKMSKQQKADLLLGKKAASFSIYEDGKWRLLDTKERKFMTNLQRVIKGLGPEGQQNVIDHADHFINMRNLAQEAGLDINKFDVTLGKVLNLAPLHVAEQALNEKVAVSLGKNFAPKAFKQLTEMYRLKFDELREIQKYLDDYQKILEETADKGKIKNLTDFFEHTRNLVEHSQENLRNNIATIIRDSKGMIDDIIDNPERFSGLDQFSHEAVEAMGDSVGVFKILAAELKIPFNHREIALDNVKQSIKNINKGVVKTENQNSISIEDDFLNTLHAFYGKLNIYFNQRYDKFFSEIKNVKLKEDGADTFTENLWMDINAQQDNLGEEFHRILKTEGAVADSKSLKNVGEILDDYAKPLVETYIRKLQKSYSEEQIAVIIGRAIKEMGLEGSKLKGSMRNYIVIKNAQKANPPFSIKEGKGEDAFEFNFSEHTIGDLRMEARMLHSIKSALRKRAGQLPEDKGAVKMALGKLAKDAEEALENTLTKPAWEKYKQISTDYNNDFVQRFYRNKLGRLIFTKGGYIGEKGGEKWPNFDAEKTRNLLNLNQEGSEKNLLENLQRVFGNPKEPLDIKRATSAFRNEDGTLISRTFTKADGSIDTVDIGDDIKRLVTRIYEQTLFGTKPLKPMAHMTKPLKEGPPAGVEKELTRQLEDTRFKNLESINALEARTSALRDEFGINLDPARASLHDLAEKNVNVRETINRVKEKLNSELSRFKESGLATLKAKKEDEIRNTLASVLKDAGATGKETSLFDALRKNYMVKDTIDGVSGLELMIRKVSKDSKIPEQDIKDFIISDYSKNLIKNYQKEIVAAETKGVVKHFDHEGFLKEITDQDNVQILKNILGDEHYKHLEGIGSFMFLMNAGTDVGQFGRALVPKGLSVESGISRIYALQRHVVSFRYVATEALLLSMRKGKAKLASEILQNKEMAELVHKILKDDKILPPKLNTRFNTLLTRTLIRQESDANQERELMVIHLLGGYGEIPKDTDWSVGNFFRGVQRRLPDVRLRPGMSPDYLKRTRERRQEGYPELVETEMQQ